MFRRIELPYKLNHLEPFISQGTMNLHYNFHHKVYENNLNEALEKFPNLWKANSLEDLISKVDDLPLELRKSVRDFGGGLLNHNFFFSILINNDNSDEKFIDSRLFKQIEKDFDRDKWMTSSEAKEYGLVDEVLLVNHRKEKKD